MAKIKIKHYTYSNKFNKKIMLLSDIHYYTKKDKYVLDNIIEIVKNNKTDYICITGDLVDANPISDSDILLNFLKELQSKATVLICLGNHDMKNIKTKYNYDEVLWNKIKKTGCHVLDNTSFKDNDVTFLGITVPFSYYYVEKEKSNIDPFLQNKFLNKADVVLMHTPTILNKTKLPKDTLFLFGHMHAGLVPSLLRPIFKNRGIVDPRKNLFPKDDYGFVKDKNSIISGGIQKISPSNPFKAFKKLFSGEVVIIDI